MRSILQGYPRVRHHQLGGHSYSIRHFRVLPEIDDLTDEDWETLITIGSHRGVYTEWGDSGAIYFFTPRRDLDLLNFERTWVEEQE